jgi:transcriptional regulator with GAF, ATPase, and Fis domain
MHQNEIELLKELNVAALQKKFLNSLLNLQNVKRGSIWIKRKNSYTCVEAAGAESENIKGTVIESHHASIVGWVIENRQMTIADPEKDTRHYKAIEDGFTIKSTRILCYPLFLKEEDEVYGAVEIIDTTPEKIRLKLEKDYLKSLEHIVNICSIALGNALMFSREKQKAQQLETALSRIKKEPHIIGQSPKLKKCMELINSYTDSDFHVLITGESGTGKELIAEQIHKKSSRRNKPFLVQNCSAIPETLLESELFGYKKGAFTGADKDREGLFQAADGGIVFLDEIGDMPMSTQAALLRVLQKNEIKPLGETHVHLVDVRVIAATNKDLEKRIAENRFRQDLYYRLSVLPVHLPPLRERTEDIPLLLIHFIDRESKNGCSAKRLTPAAMQTLMAYPWPGNIRELENLIRYLLVIIHEESIDRADLPPHILKSGDDIQPQPHDQTSGNTAQDDSRVLLSTMTWPELEKVYIHTLLDSHNWNVTQAARASGINRSTFASRMRRLDISRN